jgi:hypothetical protein
VTPVSTGAEPSNASASTPGKLHKKTPKKVKGDIPVDEGLDKENAVWKCPDPSKTVIDLKMKRPDPNNPGKFIPGKDALHVYDRDLDWNDSNSVKLLNAWRRQIWGRNFPQIRPTRPTWILSEKTALLEIIKNHLKLHSHPQWNKITNEFNRRYAGTTQCAGEPLLHPGKVKGGRLREDRVGPWRSRGGLEGKASQWDEYQALKNNSNGKTRPLDYDPLAKHESDDEISSSDESEIKDPNPEVLLPSRQDRRKQESALRRKREGETEGSEQPALKKGKKTATENDDEVADTPSKKAQPSKSNVVNSSAQTPTRKATKLVMRVESNISDKKPKDEHDDNDVTPHKKAD